MRRGPRLPFAADRIGTACLLAAVVAVLFLVSAAAAPESGAVSVVSRLRASGETSLLVEANGAAGAVADEVTLSLPANLAGRAVPAHLPEGWFVTRDKTSLRLSGPAAALPLRLRLDSPVADVPARVAVRVKSQGATLLERGVNVVRGPPVRVATSIERLLVLPRALFAGDTLTCQALDPARTPAGGKWIVAGVSAEEFAMQGGAGRAFRFRIPETLRAGDSIAVSYVDPWGERLIDAPAASQCRGSLPPPRGDRPKLEGCASMALTGQTACVCGWFPTPAAGGGLTLNGKPLGAPVSASNGVVFVRIPADATPGPAQIAGLESAGFSPEDRATVTLVRVGGEIDRTKLMRGESTPMRLWVEGTSQPLKLRVRNDTPEIIRLEGGNEQVISTDGKKPNGLTRTVYAVHVGDFTITYSLETDQCPCTGDTVTTEPTPVVYPTYPPELRTRERIPTPSPTLTPSITPTPRAPVDGTRERSHTPTPITPGIGTRGRSHTPTLPPPPPSYTPTRTPSPPPQVECKLSYTIEGGLGISIDAVGPAPPKSSKQNEAIPLYVSASDMDRLLQACACFINGKEGNTTHKYVDVPDTLQYRWRKLGGSGNMAGAAGPATLYHPPPLKVGESDSASVELQIVDLRDNDKPASVQFTITVKRVEECKFERAVTSAKKSDPGRKREITDLHLAVDCNPQDESWVKDPVPLQGQAQGKVKVCVGERALLTASGSDADTLKLSCGGACGSDQKQPELDDPVKYTWKADTGGFPDYGGHPTTDSDTTSVIYLAPAKPGSDVVRVHIGDSGKEALDPKVDKVIQVTAYKLDLVVNGHKDDSVPDCDAFYICVNDDDDDKKGVDDRDVKAAAEDDLVQVTLKMEPEKSGNVTLLASTGGDKIRVWKDSVKSEEIKLPYSPPKLPMDVWLEGYLPSDKARDVELVLKSDDPHCEVHRLFTVERPDLDMDAVPFTARQNPGGFVCINKDDDDKNQAPDKDDATAAPGVEDDLVGITVGKLPKEGSVTLSVTAGGNKVRVWEESQDHKNLKGSRAEGKSYKAQDLPKKLWVEGVKASGAPADVKLEVKDDDSGCTSVLLVTVVEVDLKASMANRGGGLVAVTEEDEEKKGAFVAANEDDDDAGGKLDVQQRPVPGENDLLRLDLDINPKPAKGRVTLQAAAGADKVQLWLEPNKATALDLGQGVTINASTLPKTFWLEGFSASNAPRDVELTLRCTEPRPCDDKVKVTAVSLHLQTDLDMNGSIDDKDWNLERKPGAYAVVNNDDDDGDGIVDSNDGAVTTSPAPGVPAVNPAERDLKRFQVVGPLPAALQNEGRVVLRRSNGKVRVFFDSRKGLANNEFQLLWSATPAGYAAGTEGNGVKTWDLSDPAQRGQFLFARENLWVEGLEASGAERDTSLALSYIPKDTAAEIDMNRIDITVVRFERIRAIIEPTPELPPRAPANVPAKHTFDNNDAAGIVYHLNDNNGDADKTFDDKHSLVLIRKANEEIPLALNHKPAVVPVKWGVARSRDDAAGLGTGVPAIDAAGAGGAKLHLDEQGSFLVFCYVDANKSGKFDEGEPRMILPLILVDAELNSNDSVAHNHVTATVNPTFIQVSAGTGPGGGFDINAPDDAAAYLAGRVDFRGGGPNGRRGLEKVFAGWVQDIPVDLDVTSDFEGGHRVSYIFARAPHPANKLYLPAPAAAPNVIATPILDTGRSPTGTGGGTATLSRSRTRVALGPAVGQRWLVETVDSPGLGYYLNHPGFAAPNKLTAFRFNLTFRARLAVWTNLDEFFLPAVPAPVPAPAAVAERTYSAVLEVNWQLRGSWTLDAAGQPVAPFFGGPSSSLAGSTVFHPPARGIDRQMSVRAPGAIQNLTENARN